MEWMDTENANRKKEFKGMVEKSLKKYKDSDHYAEATKNYLKQVSNPLTANEIYDSTQRFHSPNYENENPYRFDQTFKAHELDQLRDKGLQQEIAAYGYGGIQEYADFEDED